MEEVLRQVVLVLHGMWQKRWFGLGVAWVLSLLGGVAILLMPQQYEATAKIFVDTDSLLKPLMVGLAVQPNVEQQIKMLSRRLISRPTIEKLITVANLEIPDDSKKAKDALIDSLISRVEIAALGTPGMGNDNIYRLSFRDPEPPRAKRVVEGLTTIFIESSRGESKSDSVVARQFIEEQIKTYEVKLSEAESRLKEFRVRHLGVSEGGKGFFGRMEELSAELNKARLELREAENSRDALRKAIAGEEPMLVGPGELASKGLTPEIDARIEAVKRNLDSLLQRFTDEHPDVVGAKRVLAQLEEQRRHDLAARENGVQPRTGGAVTANPAYKELKVSLAQSEATVASLRTRVAEYEARSRQIKDAARSVPQVEAELAQLNRDYEVNKKNYEALVARRESAEMSGQMETAAGAGQFRLVEPPRVSSKPVAPNRLVLLPLLLIAALLLGAFASFAFSKLRPTFIDGTSLREATGLPLLGTVSFVESDESRRQSRQGLIGFLSGLGSLFAVFGAVFAMLLLATRATV